jgi:tetratricopeptide (TPR) repeat protein
MTTLHDAFNVDAFITNLQLLHHGFPTTSLAQTKGFDEIRQLGDRLYPHVLTALDRYRDHKTSLALFQSSTTCSSTFSGTFCSRYLGLRYRIAEPSVDSYTCFFIIVACTRQPSHNFEIARNIYNDERDLKLTKLAFLEGTIGTIHRNLDDAVSAMQHFRQELSLYGEAANKGMIKAYDKKVAIAYEHMAVATQQLGLYDEAFIWHKNNLQIMRTHYAEDVIGLAMALVNKSWALWKTGKLDEAEEDSTGDWKRRKLH